MIAPTLNELSLSPADVPMQDRVKALIAVLKRLDALGFPKVVRHARDALECKVLADTSLKMWLFQRAPKEEKLFLLGRMAKAPFVEQLHKEQEEQSGFLLDVMCGGVPAAGAGVAYLHDAPAVALPGVPCWEVDPLVVRLTRVSRDDETLLESDAEVVHLCRPEQVNAREAVLRDRVLREVSGGDDLWQRRLDLFPRLSFCDGVERQVRALSGREFFFQQVVVALSRLDKALVGWTSGSLHPGMDSSGESTATLNHSTYGPMRDFMCPDRQSRRFSNHLKLFSCNWRIYYWESRTGDAGGRALIGYIGGHLPTVTYRT